LILRVLCKYTCGLNSVGKGTTTSISRSQTKGGDPSNNTNRYMTIVGGISGLFETDHESTEKTLTKKKPERL